MNYTKQQTVVTETYYNALNLLEKIYKEKLIQAIVEIVRENGGLIELTDEIQDGESHYIDWENYGIMVYIPLATMTDMVISPSYVFELGLTEFRYVFDNSDGDDGKFHTMAYDDAGINILSNILKQLFNQHKEHDLPF